MQMSPSMFLARAILESGLALLLLGSGLAGAEPVAPPPAQAASASGISRLHVFRGVHRGGTFPDGRLTQLPDGALVGATYDGSAKGAGAIFKLQQDGLFDVLAKFNLMDGAHPIGSLVQLPSGFLYGTTDQGGDFNDGVLFRLDPAGGDPVVLYSFDSQGWGGPPASGLTPGPDGSLYGILPQRGYVGPSHIFRMGEDGQFDIVAELPLHDGCGDYDLSPLAISADGHFFAVSQGGLPASCLVRVNARGAGTTLHQFESGEWALGVTLAADGDLYVVTNFSHDACGQVYRFTVNGAGRSIHHFACSPWRTYPIEGLTQAADGTLVGTGVRYKGAKQQAFVYWLNPDGSSRTEDVPPEMAVLLHQVTLAADGTAYANGYNAQGTGAVVQIDP